MSYRDASRSNSRVSSDNKYARVNNEHITIRLSSHDYIFIKFEHPNMWSICPVKKNITCENVKKINFQEYFNCHAGGTENPKLFSLEIAVVILFKFNHVLFKICTNVSFAVRCTQKGCYKQLNARLFLHSSYL